jgi:hypothetical protein
MITRASHHLTKHQLYLTYSGNKQNRTTNVTTNPPTTRTRTAIITPPSEPDPSDPLRTIVLESSSSSSPLAHGYVEYRDPREAGSQSDIPGLQTAGKEEIHFEIKTALNNDDNHKILLMTLYNEAYKSTKNKESGHPDIT